MSLRVIGGSARGKRLKLVPGDSTRPIMDRVKEALFNIIGMDILDATILDLFAGTGSVAIEALSRGAAHAVMLDLDRNAIQTIQANLAATGFTDQAVVRRIDAFSFLAATPNQSFDYIYIAPPQYKEFWLKALMLLDSHPEWLTADGEIIVQIDPEEKRSIDLRCYEAYDERKYGRTLLIFYRSIQPETRSNNG
ncbi:MAG: 16S rRNA (guanine(966)-N(2))-methyltransferase RsmD [Anaerolineae bacterium]|nr:16S rRNA (guanine(966)-N(2))-methyltransferase RsmD [Anaerolineae bacterium]